MSRPPDDQTTQLARRLGLFDATMIVMGGIIGSGIFINPYVVAQRVHTQFLILGVWVFGGLLALIAAFVWAELAAWRPDVGGSMHIFAKRSIQAWHFFTAGFCFSSFKLAAWPRLR
jgi:amino acid transporter